MEFTPSNGVIRGANLIQVGVAPDSDQRTRLQGTLSGAAEVEVDAGVSSAESTIPAG